MPDYRTEKGGLIEIDVQSRECPKSIALLNPELKALILLDTRNRQAQRATGAAMFGHDSGLWPAVWFDAITALQSARDEEESARHEAALRDARR